MSDAALRAGGHALKRAPGEADSSGGVRRRWDRPAVVVLLAAGLSAAIAVTLALTVFRRLSVNGDESVYLLQARSLAHGHLFPPVTQPADSFTPWLGVIHGGHYVLKYTPVVAAFFAFSLVLTGGYVTGLAVLAAALVGATFLLGKEVTGSRSVAATAAVFMAASPVVLVQSALILPYVLFLVLGELAMWALIAGCRRASPSMLALAGLCTGLAFAARTFDAILALAPAVLWLAWRTRTGRLRLVSGFVAGLAAPVAGLLWFDDAATGSPLRLPFSLFQSGDTLGFGTHRLYPGEAGRHFGLAQGWQGLSRHLELLGGGWAFGGVILVALAVVALVRRRVSPAALAVLAGGLLLTFGYLFFWGIWNAAVVWGAVRYLGPYYLMPLLVPLSMLGALGLHEVAKAGLWRAVSAVTMAAIVSGVALVPALRSDLALTADNVRLARAISAQGHSLVFVDTYPSYLQHPTPVISNRVPAGGKTVYALARGGADFQVLQAFPGRPVYRLRLVGEYGKLPHARYGAQLERVAIVRGRDLTFSLTVTPPANLTDARLDVIAGRLHRHWSLASSRAAHLQFQLDPAAGLQPGSTDSLTVYLTSASRPDRVLDHLTVGLRVGTDGTISALVPSGVVAELGPSPAPALSVAAR
ncbi:MAG TPA: glycosyltransferase family 39 protein [Frankiaceae bacterium]|jgi:4-amino-4-deoxy-L-arabinose transferase-like glycosyltransferase|nr:glycosyltransferase family 39 protein [Frankiaceae bacterium]